MILKRKIINILKVLPIPLFVNMYPHNIQPTTTHELYFQNPREIKLERIELPYEMLFTDSLSFIKKNNLENKALFEDIESTQKRRNTPQEFIDSIKDIAIQKHNETGIPASVMIAQVAVETGWGKSVVGNNFFNIKGTNSNGKLRKTKEFENGRIVLKEEVFRVYDNIEGSFEDYSKIISNSRLYSNAMKKIDNPSAFIAEIHKSGYATDPNYARKVREIINQYNLCRFDTKNNRNANIDR